MSTAVINTDTLLFLYEGLYPDFPLFPSIILIWAILRPRLSQIIFCHTPLPCLNFLISNSSSLLYVNHRLPEWAGKFMLRRKDLCWLMFQKFLSMIAVSPHNQDRPSDGKGMAGQTCLSSDSRQSLRREKKGLEMRCMPHWPIPFTLGSSL